ncbi:MAG: BON domain-containing protein [Actinomycetota bacterium]|nr:BON domain-containing protein [Actinomycetota bacterium]
MARFKAKGARLGASGARVALTMVALTGLARRRAGRSTVATLVAGAAGALAEFFLDPQDGKRRRTVARDKVTAFVRRRGRDAAGAAKYAGGVVQGAASRAAPVGGRPDAEERLNDPALARKVESEIFREPDAPKGSVDVNAENGVIYLRGEVEDPDQITALVEKAKAVEGVQAVENLLHPPGTPAPSKGDGHAAGLQEERQS